MNEKASIGPDSVIEKNKDVICSEIEGEVVMMSVEKGMYYGLDSIGSRIWEIIDKPTALSEVCGILAKEYDVEKDRCEKDVIVFLEKMIEEEVIRVR